MRGDAQPPTTLAGRLIEFLYPTRYRSGQRSAQRSRCRTRSASRWRRFGAWRAP